MSGARVVLPARGVGSSAGFTLIELLVALALFALISLAGLSLIETTVGVQQRTDGRSQRLAEVQRALFLITADLEQLTAGPVQNAGTISLTRGSADGAYLVSYRLSAGSLVRSALGVERPILTDVTNVRFRFFKNGMWSEQPVSEDSPERPRGVELALELGQGSALGRGGEVKRVIELPAQ